MDWGIGRGHPVPRTPKRNVPAVGSNDAMEELYKRGPGGVGPSLPASTSSTEISPPDLFSKRPNARKGPMPPACSEPAIFVILPPPTSTRGPNEQNSPQALTRGEAAV